MATAQHHDDQQTLKRALLDFVAETRHKDYETPEQTKELMQVNTRRVVSFRLANTVMI